MMWARAISIHASKATSERPTPVANSAAFVRIATAAVKWLERRSTDPSSNNGDRGPAAQGEPDRAPRLLETRLCKLRAPPDRARRDPLHGLWRPRPIR